MCFPIKFAKFLRTSFLKNTSGRLILDMKFFQAIFYSHSRNIWNFSRKIYFLNNQALFAIYALKPRHVDRSIYRMKQRVHLQSFHASVNIKKIRNFLMLFCLLFAKVVSPKTKKFVKTVSFRRFSKN